MDQDHIKEFDKWNIKKKLYHNQNKKPPLFKERDIWWLSVGVNIGFEEDGKNDNFVRPVLIVKKFNREIYLGVPMSSRIKDNIYYVPVTVKKETVSVMTSQLRVFSSRRMWNKLAELDEGDFFRVLEELGRFFVLPFSQKQEGRG